MEGRGEGAYIDMANLKDSKLLTTYQGKNYSTSSRESMGTCIDRIDEIGEP